MSYEDQLIREMTTDQGLPEPEDPNESTETDGALGQHGSDGMPPLRGPRWSQSNKRCPRCNMPTYRHKLSGLIDCGNDCNDRGLI